MNWIVWVICLLVFIFVVSAILADKRVQKMIKSVTRFYQELKKDRQEYRTERRPKKQDGKIIGKGQEKPKESQ